MGVKSNITYVFPHNYAKIKVDSYDCLPLKKTSIFHDVIMHIESVSNKYQNHSHYNIFVETFSFQLPKNNNNKQVLYKLCYIMIELAFLKELMLLR